MSQPKKTLIYHKASIIGLIIAPMLAIMFALLSLTMCTLGGTFNALVSEAAEYTYLKTGKRIDGSMYSFTSFGMKV